MASSLIAGSPECRRLDARARPAQFKFDLSTCAWHIVHKFLPEGQNRGQRRSRGVEHGNLDEIAMFGQTALREQFRNLLAVYNSRVDSIEMDK